MFPVGNTLLDYNFPLADRKSVMVNSKSANRCLSLCWQTQAKLDEITSRDFSLGILPPLVEPCSSRRTEFPGGHTIRRVGITG